MCGSYNSSILKELDNIEAMTTFLPLGLKGYEYIKLHNHYLLEDYIVELDDDSEEKNIRGRFRDYYEKPADDHTYVDILNLSKKILARQHKGEIAEVHLVYGKYINSMAYKVVNHMVLPVYDIKEKHELSVYLAQLLALSIYGAVGEASLNEYGARRLAMKNATDNAEEILSGLETQYHRARQAQITDELIEIISGTESQRALEMEKQKARKK